MWMAQGQLKELMNQKCPIRCEQPRHRNMLMRYKTLNGSDIFLLGVSYFVDLFMDVIRYLVLAVVDVNEVVTVLLIRKCEHLFMLIVSLDR